MEKAGSRREIGPRAREWIASSSPFMQELKDLSLAVGCLEYQYYVPRISSMVGNIGSSKGHKKISLINIKVMV
jgi:hypothetical protein